MRMKHSMSFLVGLGAAMAGSFRSMDIRQSKSKGYRTINRLNRSRHWPSASSYKHARSLSPFPNMPVR